MDDGKPKCIGKVLADWPIVACVAVNIAAVSIYVASFFKWSWQTDTIVRVGELLTYTWIVSLVEFASIVVLALILKSAGFRLLNVGRRSQSIFIRLFLFGLALFFITAISFPSHDLRFDGDKMKMGNGRWTQIAAPEAENYVRYELRDDLSNIVCFTNLAAMIFVRTLFEKRLP
jgi:hypothetical protein